MANAPKRTIDDYLQFLGELKVAEQQYHEELQRKSEEEAMGIAAPRSAPRTPAPRAPAPAPRAPAQPTPPRAAQPSPQPPSPEPAPRPAPPRKEDKPIDRSPSAAARRAGGGSLDDLFGGAQEGRLDIGRRTRRSAPQPTDPED